MAHHQHQHHQSTASKAPPALDWLSFPAPTVVDAPHPDLFDFELDNSLSAYDQTQLQGLTLDYNTNAEAFQFYRSETPQGPPSVITASSESAYETLSQHSESLYNYSNPSPSQYGVDPSFTAADLGIDFSSFNVQSTTDMAVLSSLLDAHETLSSYSAGGRYDLSATRSTYSASAGSYGPAGTGAIAPQHTSMPRAPSADSPKSPDSSLTGEGGDSRKKYACPDCSRSFARAYNLKTHRATHDPHRLKPYVCPHRNCGRSFSRKHDLGRHLVSIHRDDTGSQYSVGGHSTASERSHHVGLSAEKAVRTWCDNCGRSLVGAQRTCNCNDVK